MLEDGERWRVVQGDCLDVMRSLPDASADAIVTDPPYCSGGYLEAQKNTKAQGLRTATVQKDDFEWFTSDNLGTAGFTFLLRSVMVEALRVLRPNRSAFLFTDWRMVAHIAPAVESCGLRFRNMIVWDKGSAGLGSGFKPSHELILEFCKGTTDYQTLDGQNVIRGNRVHGGDKVHPAQKPPGVMRELIRVAVASGGTIIDPFTGSGSTGVAALSEGCRFLGIEREPHHCEIARRRLSEESTRPTLFVAAGKSPQNCGKLPPLFSETDA